MIWSFQSPTKKWHKTQPAVSTNTVCPALQFFKGRIGLADHHYSLWSRPRSLATSGLLTGGSPGATGGSEGSNWHWEGLEGSPGPGRSGEDWIIRDPHSCQLVHGGGIDCNHNPPGMTIGILTGHRAVPSVPENQALCSEQRMELN